MTGPGPVTKRSARAILLSRGGQLLLIKRTKPGQPPYWTAPGGGVEDSDASVQAALRRELSEELGATVSGVSQVFLVSSPTDGGVSVQHIFAAILLGSTSRRAPATSTSTRPAAVTSWTLSTCAGTR